MSPAVYKYVVCSFRRQRKISYLEVKELKGRGGKGGKGRERRRGKEGRERDGREEKGYKIFMNRKEQHPILKAAAVLWKSSCWVQLGGKPVVCLR